MKKLKSLFSFLGKYTKLFLAAFLTAFVTVLFAQVDSTGTGSPVVSWLTQLVQFFFGDTASQTVAEVGAKVVGYLVIIAGIADTIRLLLPSNSPTSTILGTILLWLKKIIGDKKSASLGGGSFPVAPEVTIIEKIVIEDGKGAVKTFTISK